MCRLFVFEPTKQSLTYRTGDFFTFALTGIPGHQLICTEMLS